MSLQVVVNKLWTERWAKRQSRKAPMDDQRPCKILEVTISIPSFRQAIIGSNNKSSHEKATLEARAAEKCPTCQTDSIGTMEKYKAL